MRAWWSLLTCDQRADFGEASVDHGFGLPAKSSGLTISRLRSSFLRLVCLFENTSASITTFASSPFALWMVITLTASPGGTVTASKASEPRSRRWRTLSARTIGSPPTSVDMARMTSTICSTSCRDTGSGYAVRISDLSMVSSSRSMRRPERESSHHLSTSARCRSLTVCSESLASRSSPRSEPSMKLCSCASSRPIRTERATQAA